MSLRNRLEKARENRNTEDINNVKDQINTLQSERDELQNLLDNLKSQYQSSTIDLDDFKNKSSKISDIYNEYKAELADQGVEDKADLIKTATDEDVEVVEYKESGAKLREGVSQIRQIKKALKEKNLDLNFTANNEDGSPREDSIKIIEDKIAEIDAKIESLKESNPEYVDAEKVAECVAAMKAENFEYLAEGFVPRITSETVINYSLIGRFKDKFSTPQITAALSEIVSEMLDRKQKSDPDTYTKEKVENIKEAFKRESVAYLAYEKKEKLERDSEISDARQRVASVESDINFKESAYKDFVQMKLKYEDALNETVEIRRGFRIRDKTYPDIINFKYKSVDTQTEVLMLGSSKRGLAETELELTKLKRETPGFFGRKKYEQRIATLEDDIKKHKDAILKQEKEIEEMNNRSRILSQNISEIGKLLFEPKIYKKWTRGDFAEMTLKEVFDFMQGVFDSMETNIDPKDTEMVDRYNQAKNEYKKVDREYAEFIMSLKTRAS